MITVGWFNFLLVEVETCARAMMNKNSLTYRFLRGYAIGFAIAGSLYILPQVATIAQLFLGISLGTLGWTWLKNIAESNKK